MKIGIVTYVRTDNYGAELQGYALQHRLNTMGYNAEVLDIDHNGMDSSTYRKMIIKGVIKRLKHNPLRGISEVMSIAFRMNANRKVEHDDVKKKGRESAFQEFWDNAIAHSVHLDINNLSKETEVYDILIAGSDQIWNYLRTAHLDVYFLRFASPKQIKFSYAASLSISKIPNNRRQEYIEHINSLSTISVRESQGAEIIKQLTGREVQVVLDPTLLLDKEEWMDISSDRIDICEPYILSYSLSSSRGYWRIVYGYAEKYGLKVVNLRHDYVEESIPSFRIDIYDAGPREFIHLLAKASLVITNSFHGTIFSMNFNVPFISVISRISDTNSRILSILKNARLDDRLIYDDDTVTNKSIKVDFCNSNAFINHQRLMSLKFLIDNLNKNA